MARPKTPSTTPPGAQPPTAPTPPRPKPAGNVGREKIMHFDHERIPPFDHLDPTKIIPQALVPLQVVGRMVLDRWPDNFFAETSCGRWPEHMAGLRIRAQAPAARAGA